MGEAQEVQLPKIVCQGATETIPNGDNGNMSSQSRTVMKMKKKYEHWLRIGLYVVLVLVGQSSAILLGRLYYQEGGKSKWIATLVNLVGFPILLPFYTIPASKHPSTANNNTIHNNNDKQPSSTLKLASVYVSLGILLALDCFLYSMGLSYLPVSTYSLICSSKLAFNAIFSFFLNSQKFTPYIINSIVLLTVSSILLVLQPDSSSSAESSSTEVSEKKYVIGFISTVGAAAGYGLLLSLNQVAFSKVVNRSFKGILDMIVYPSFVACLATVIGLFGSGEYRTLRTEMEEYEMGKASYVMTLSFTAITWQVYTVGCLSLILEVSSLFSNVISVLGLPVVPILAVVLFHDTMNGLKMISLLLALWGVSSYIYQYYLDKTKSKTHQHTRHNNIFRDS